MRILLRIFINNEISRSPGFSESSLVAGFFPSCPTRDQSWMEKYWVLFFSQGMLGLRGNWLRGSAWMQPETFISA